MSDYPTPPQRPELSASLGVLTAALKSGAGLVAVTAVLMLLVVTYHREAAVDLGLLSPDWALFGWIGLNILCLFVVPALLIKLVMRERLKDYGLAIGEWRTWLRHAGIYALVAVPLIAIASRLGAFRAYYPMFHLAREQPALLVPWEVAYGAYFFAWEFFFRGYLLRALARPFGPAAIVIQTIPFVMMHFGKPEAEVAASVVAGIFLGLMAYRGRSMIGCWLLHWACAATMDLLALV
jgi:membrane protease YdiL (CAAX protease family)